jgi:CheY-like chemotaxis protein
VFWVVQYLQIADISHHLSILDLATKFLLFFVIRAQDLQQDLTAALQLAQQRSACLATLAHEIRTPLHTAIACMELEQNPEIMKRALFHMLSLCNDVLTIAALENSQEVVPTDTFPVRDLLEEVMESALLSPDLRDTTLVSMEIATEAPTLIHTSRIRMRQAIDNLMNNAMRYTLRGTIVLRLSSSPSHAVFTVTDTGIGISEEHMKDIFDPFKRHTDYHAGVGLGLAIVRYTTDILGGTIRVKSTLGVGSEFSVEIPLLIPPAQIPHTVSTAAVTRHRLPPRSKQRAMVVEDNVINRKLLIKMLARAGFTSITEAEDGRAFVETYVPETCDVLFVDIHMPRLDGLSAVRELLDAGHILPFIFVCTASVHSVEDEQWKSLGIPHVFLRKPITLSAIQDALSKYID